ncbi:MAG: MBL fold metallo-hydrolase, partial [Candidatus Bipolaricaulota bacterium]
HKEEVTQGLFRYVFPPEPGKHYSFNLFVLLAPEERRALLIDTGFEPHAAAVAEDLGADGYAVTDVVLSHLHDDHFLGLRPLPPVTLHASPNAREALSRLYAPEDLALFSPDDPLADGSSFAFGPFRLTFVEAPGHSPCSLFTVIDDGIVHVGDLVMASEEGVPILPYVEFDDVAAHIETLERLLGSVNHTLLLGHGPNLVGDEAIEKAIGHRLCYLRAVLAGEGKLTYEESMADCPGTFVHTEWHARAPEIES